MSETTSDDEQRPVAPGIANAMRNARHAGELTHRHRHRWNLPSDREPHSEPEVDER